MTDTFPFFPFGDRSLALVTLAPGASWRMLPDGSLDWLTPEIPQPTEDAIQAEIDRPKVVVPQTISDRQFFQQLAIVGICTQQEALDAVKTGAVPASLATLLSQMPADQQFGANMIVSGATQFERNHPMTVAIGTAYGWTSDQIDAFFQAASLL